MNALIIYDSLYGNTWEITEAIASALRQYGHARTVPAGSVTAEDLAGLDLLVVGGPTQKHGLSPKLEDLLDRIPPEAVAGMPVAAFDTRVHIAEWLSGSAADKIAKRLTQMGSRLVLPAESFFVTGKEGPLEQGELQRAQTWAHAALEKLSSMIVCAY
jgi:flavodoxin